MTSAVRTRRPWGLVVAATAALLLASSCAPSAGTPEVGGWFSVPIFAVLHSVPASAENLRAITLQDAARLNALNSAATPPLPTAATSQGELPPSDEAWTKYASSIPYCADLLTRQGAGAASEASIGPMTSIVTVYSDPDRKAATISVCAGPVDPSRLQGAFSGEPKPSTVADMTGLGNQELWVGYRESTEWTYAIGDDIPVATTTAVVAGTAVAASLADDPGVRAVVSALPTAASIEMGTFLIGSSGSSGFGGSRISEAMQRVLSSAGRDALPRPAFGGYGWSPRSGLLGSAMFVTTYTSGADAQLVGDLLTQAWSNAADTEFGAATTAVSGTTVVTTVTEVESSAFDVRTHGVSRYPGWGGTA